MLRDRAGCPRRAFSIFGRFNSAVTNNGEIRRQRMSGWGGSERKHHHAVPHNGRRMKKHAYDGQKSNCPASFHNTLAGGILAAASGMSNPQFAYEIETLNNVFDRAQPPRPLRRAAAKLSQIRERLAGAVCANKGGVSGRERQPVARWAERPEIGQRDGVDLHWGVTRLVMLIKKT